MNPAHRINVAGFLYEMFEMRFQRRWEDLPIEVQDYWLENTDDLVAKLRSAGLEIEERDA